MLNDIAKAWVEALRSGEFAQERQMLRSNNGYCCLGVLCELHRKATGLGHWENTGGDWHYITHDTDGKDVHAESVELPIEVRDWAGVISYSGEFWDKGWGRARNLARINDDGSSFAEIADIIESDPTGLLRIDPY